MFRVVDWWHVPRKLTTWLSIWCSWFRRVIQAKDDFKPVCLIHTGTYSSTEALRCSNWGDNVLVIKSIMKFPVCGNCVWTVGFGSFFSSFLFVSMPHTNAKRKKIADAWSHQNGAHTHTFTHMTIEWMNEQANTIRWSVLEQLSCV